ncbi:MAG: adenylate kinase [Acidobacteria bacterium]|nr:adenylate kinase [Acidobacteriota bacterium]MXW72497.1 adenylate kinase [Acidobacteriota bacterium]MXX87412.1 adenylate kinase [Acidobacteriota bacterium]MYE44894.1 adenylate kinase [Acidobacteriota bacterium]MYF76644.1 adenylate kinase [Acidobacteriota bacterium]
MNAIILLGAPGSGKGTQAERLAESLGLPHISTGAILRQAVADGTELGRAARDIMAAGRLVSDEIVLGIVEERVSAPDCRRGFILDGYPRNRAQARALGEVLSRLGATEWIANIAVPAAELAARVRGRRGTDGRQDDSEDAFRRRLEVYESESLPLLDYYGDRAVNVSGLGSRDEVFSRLCAALPFATAQLVTQ